jgi:hypothetical protein
MQFSLNSKVANNLLLVFVLRRIMSSGHHAVMIRVSLKERYENE